MIGMNGSRAKQLKLWQQRNLIDTGYLSTVGEVPVDEVHDLSKKDIGRWILNNPQISLNESLSSDSSPVSLSRIDELSLLVSLRYLTNDKYINGEVMAFFVSPEVYSFPLLLTFHLLIHQGTENLISDGIQINRMFSENSGVLLVSGNVELSSRLIRTCYGAFSLNECFRTLKLKIDGSFEPLSRQQPKDLSYPWFGFFRGYRHQYPKNLKMAPELLVIDAIPIKHRDRLQQLIEWGKECGIKKIITVCSLGDSDNYKQLKSRNSIIFPIDQVALGLYNGLPTSSMKDKVFRPITGCWTHLHSQACPARVEQFNLNKILGAESVENKINDVFKIINAAEAKCNDNTPVAISRLKAVLLDLLTMIVPVYWYERERKDSGQATLRELIYMSRKAVPISLQEKAVFEFMLPVISDTTQEIYDVLNCNDKTPKGAGLLQVLRKTIRNDGSKKIVILVNDTTTVKVLIPWISSSMGAELTLETELQVYTFKEFFREKITFVELKEDKKVTTLICLGWIPRKYLGLLCSDISNTIEFVLLPSEEKIVEQQILGNFGNKIYRDHQNCRITTYHKLFGNSGLVRETYDGIGYKPRVHRSELQIKIKFLKEETKERDIGNVFGKEALANLLQASYQSNGNLADLDNIVNTDDLDDMGIDDIILHFSAYRADIRNQVSALRIGLNDDKEIYLSTIEEYKIFAQDVQKLVDRPASAIYRGDYIVRLKGNERKEIFDGILEASGQTPMMTYIRYRIQQWQGLVKRLYDKCDDPGLVIYEVYESMLKRIRLAGGTVSHINTIANWMRGKSNCVRDYENVRAVAIALGDQGNLEQYRRIHQAMRNLWNIHIEIGLKLSHSLRRQISRVVEGLDAKNEYIQIVDGVRIPIQEVVEAIDIFEVIDTDRITLRIPSLILGRVLSISERKRLFGEFPKEAH